MYRMFTVAAVVSLFSFVLLAQEDAEEKEKEKATTTVVVPEDTTPFDVTQDQIVRLPATSMSGSTFSAKVVNGPAKIVREMDVEQRINGRMPIGAAHREFTVEPTGAGKVTVAITIKSPTAPNPETKEYQFTVKQ